MRIDAFIDADEFKSQMDEYIRVFRATRPAPGTSGPLLPGDPEREAEQVRREQGIPLLPAVMKDLLDVSEKIGVPLGEPN
jgi:L-2-hydroxycarboxylate dehydrogenase (NAD+)